MATSGLSVSVAVLVTLAAVYFQEASALNTAPIEDISDPTTGVLIPIPICPTVLCIQPPDNCQLQFSNELDSNGCSKFPCGILDCNCDPCPIPPPFCTLTDQSFNFITGCPSCDFTCCPIVDCLVPPPGCFYVSSNEVGSDGCPLFPCGELICPCPIPLCAGPQDGCIIEFSDEVDGNGCPLFPCGIEVCPNITLVYGEPFFTLTGEISVPLLYTSITEIFGLQFNFTGVIPTGFEGGAAGDANFDFISGKNLTLAINLQGTTIPPASPSTLLTNIIFSGDNLEQEACLEDSSIFAGAQGVALDYGFIFGNNCIFLFVVCATEGTGDVTQDNVLNISDVILIIAFITQTQPANQCIFDTADINGDGAITIADVVLLTEMIVSS